LSVSSTPSSRASAAAEIAHLIALAATLAWVGALIAGPYALAQSSADTWQARAAATVYAAGRLICHQQPVRSFAVWGRPLPVCARCTGLYLAAPVGAACAWAASKRRRRASRMGSAGAWRAILILSAAPTVLSLVVEWSRLAPVSRVVRALAALPLGCAVAWLVAATMADLAAPNAATRGPGRLDNEVNCKDA
jgi:hypothetical protein